MTNKQRIQENNANLRECIEIANALPEAGGGGGEPTPTQEKSVDIVENGTVEVTPDEGYALSKVTANVNVPIPDGYIKPSGTLQITKNGLYFAADVAAVNVNGPIPDGYIKPSGTLNIDKNGSYDVTEKAGVVVAVPDRAVVLQDKTVTENGTYTADSGYDGLGTVTVQVASSGGGVDDEEVEAYAGLFNNTTVNFESDKITKLSKYAFAYRTSLKTLSLPNLKSSNERAFANCDSMTSLSIPNMTGATNTYMAAYCAAIRL